VTEEQVARRQQIDQQLAVRGHDVQGYLDSEEQTEEEFNSDLERGSGSHSPPASCWTRSRGQSLGCRRAGAHPAHRASCAAVGAGPNEYIRHAMEHNHVPELVGEIRRGKALAEIVESAVVTDESGNIVDLKGLQPDGALVDASEAEARWTSSLKPTRTRPPRTERQSTVNDELTLEATIDVEAAPTEVWAVVSDLRRMGE
jgi:trigger factor